MPPLSALTKTDGAVGWRHSERFSGEVTLPTTIDDDDGYIACGVGWGGLVGCGPPPPPPPARPTRWSGERRQVDGGETRHTAEKANYDKKCTTERNEKDAEGDDRGSVLDSVLFFFF